MKRFVTAHDVANTVKMAHNQRRVTFMLVEGATDVLFFRRFAEPSRCEVIPCHSRRTALQATSILDASHEAGFLTFVDADWDRILMVPLKSPNLIVSDGHDLVIDLLCSPALDRLLAERGSAAKIAAFEETAGASVRQALLDRAATLGRLRLHNHSESLSLKFEGLEPHLYADRDTLVLDFTKVVAVVVQRSSSTEKPQDLHFQCGALAQGGYDSRQIAVGHDATALLGLGLRNSLGSQTAIEVRPETLELELRLAFDDRCMRATELFAEIKAWENRNAGWSVLQ